MELDTILWFVAFERALSDVFCPLVIFVSCINYDMFVYFLPQQLIFQIAVLLISQIFCFLQNILFSFAL